jgi:beta-galactosidase
MIETTAQYFADGPQVVLQSDGEPRFRFTVMPPAPPPHSVSAVRATRRTTDSVAFETSEPAVQPGFGFERVAEGGSVPPVRMGPPLSLRPHGVAEAPDEAEFREFAAKWKIVIRSDAWQGVNDLVLQIHYDGDVARLVSGGHLLTDNFYNGQTWRVGLRRFRQEIEAHGLELEVLPRRADAPIFLENAARDPGLRSGQVGETKEIKLVPQYQVVLNFAPER